MFNIQVHFDSSMWEKTREDGSRRLRTNAIPTIFPSSKPKRTIQRYTAKSMLIPETTATTHYYSTQSTSFWTPVNISPVSNDKKSTSVSTSNIDTIDLNSNSCDETDPMTPICVIEEFFSMEELIVKNRDLQQKNKKLNRNNQEIKMALDIALNKIKELESKLDKKNIVYDSKELINMNPYLIKIESKR